MFKKYNFQKLDKKINTDIKNRTILLNLKKLFLSIVLIFCFISIAFITILNIYLNKINKINIDKTDIGANETFSKQEDTPPNNGEDSVQETNPNITNIALFGIDEVEGTAGRSDCIMIFTIDNKHNKLKLSSIIRDSYVAIPTINRKDKINHAYAFGGPKLALQTINANFNLNLDRFITVNFSSLPKIIDDIGGINLTITNDEFKYINDYIDDLNEKNNTNVSNITSPGIQLVNGIQALAYCRIRYTEGGDFERTQRHRNVLNQVFKKSKDIPITQYPKLLDEILPILHTNLDKTEIISLALNLNSLKNTTMLQDRFPCDEDGTGKVIDGIYYYVFDGDLTAKRIHNFIFEDGD
ncbi:LCP family protein [uncultured Clostridium sp.]|uniref:LCP family protein n=1 Tax=uncultured Clostridium sp. TaxID=59620 RepID=UPI0028E9F74C|nr:LCP family protein [uncultured Clostridium sp.]